MKLLLFALLSGLIITQVRASLAVTNPQMRIFQPCKGESRQDIEIGDAKEDLELVREGLFYDERNQFHLKISTRLDAGTVIQELWIFTFDRARGKYSAFQFADTFEHPLPASFVGTWDETKKTLNLVPTAEAPARFTILQETIWKGEELRFRIAKAKAP